MNIQAEKIEIMRLILETENPIILESIKALFGKRETSDFWETLSDAQKEDIFKGIDDIENGKVVDYDDFMKDHLK